jgi:chromosome segregation protein
MRLKHLEVIGFKSFGQKTGLDFPPGITAVVGPNGCGKSNVVDAIRWVLGEQSPKHLRGDSMEDVIFKGNDRLPPMGMAQVALTFENEPGRRELSQLDLDISTLPAHFRDLSEITVTRRYFRAGESEYFINKMPCRLKDITELFLGTGVGSKAYAIIEQGRVEQLINAKPEDRRLFIEEAAGTTLYRSRRLAAERKIERTRENLLRVNDVLRELDRQVQYLHRMAKKAEQYRSLQEELRGLDVNVSAVHWRRLAAAVADAEQHLGELQQSEQEHAAAIEELERERADRVSRHAATEDELSRQRAAAAALDEECRSLAQQIAFVRREVAQREQRLARLDQDSAGFVAQRAELAASMEEAARARADDERLLEADDRDLTRAADDLAQGRRDLASAAAAVDSLKDRVVGAASQEADRRNAQLASERRRDDARRRAERLLVEHDAAIRQLGAVEEALHDRRALVTSLRERVRATEGEKERRAERVRTLAEDRRRLEREAVALGNQLVQTQSRLESVQELQRTYEGYQKGVRSILLEEQDTGGVVGVVADVLEVPMEYERAVAAALGDRLQYVIVRQEDDGRNAVQMLRQKESGRGSFIPLAPRQVLLNGNGAASLNGSTRRLLDIVQVDEPYRRVAETLLGEVVLVPDLDTGLALWRKNGVHVTMVTPEGDVIDATGVISGGSERPVEQEIVSRRRVVGELSNETVQLGERVHEVECALARVAADLVTEEAALQALDRDLHALTLELVAVEKDLERLEVEQPRCVDRVEVVRFEAAAATDDSAQGAAEVTRLDAELAALASERGELEGALHDAQARVATLNACVATLSEGVTAVTVRIAERRQRLQAAEAAVAHVRARLVEAEAREAARTAERAETERERSELEAAVEQAERRRAERQTLAVATEEAIQVARAALDAAAGAVAEYEQRMTGMRAGLDALRADRGRCEIALAEDRVRATHTVEAARERYGIDLAAHEPPADFVADESVTQRIEVLREKLAKIGEVNVAAIDELRELEERAQFLRTQKADLERSLADLERTIQRLNRASRTKFAETFVAVNAKFQEVFPQLFRGGEARLVLTDEHNPLESGVEIVVRPPGKKLETTTLLSGGEKALVAVSLIFSLFLINPTPFCFLDEVDAPLDDANIGRFTTLLTDMSRRSQFIVITHNKRTMQAADVLYGVTMEEPGASKLISVAMR